MIKSKISGMYSMQQQPMQQYGMQPGYGQPMGMPYNMQQMNSQVPKSFPFILKKSV